MKRLKKSAKQFDRRYKAVLSNLITLFLDDCKNQGPARVRVLYSNYNRMWKNFSDGANKGAVQNNTPITCNVNAFKEFFSNGITINRDECTAEQYDEYKRIFGIMKKERSRLYRLKAWIGTLLLIIFGSTKPKNLSTKPKLSVVK